MPSQGILRALSGARASTLGTSTAALVPDTTAASCGSRTRGAVSDNSGGGNRKDDGARAWAARTSSLSVSERRNLRAFLLQQRWFAGAGVCGG